MTSLPWALVKVLIRKPITSLLKYVMWPLQITHALSVHRYCTSGTESRNEKKKKSTKLECRFQFV